MSFFKKNRKIIISVGLAIIVIVTTIVATITINNSNKIAQNEEKAVEGKPNENTKEDIKKVEEKASISPDVNKINEESTDKSATEVSTASTQNDSTCEKESCENKKEDSKNNNQGDNSNKETPSTAIKKENSEKIMVQGYLIDEDCFVSYTDPSKETLGCLNMPECAASGYGIAFLDGEKYKFYLFDGNISTYGNGKRIANATGGQQLAWDFINTKIKENNIPVKVTGYITEETRTNPDSSTADNIYYPVFKVDSITQ